MLRYLLGTVSLLWMANVMRVELQVYLNVSYHNVTRLMTPDIQNMHDTIWGTCSRHSHDVGITQQSPNMVH